MTGSRPCNKPPKLCSPRHARSKRGRSSGAPSAYESGFGLRPPLCRVPSDTAYHEEARLVADLNCRMRYPESRYSARSECSPRLPLVRWKKSHRADSPCCMRPNSSTRRLRWPCTRGQPVKSARNSREPSFIAPKRPSSGRARPLRSRFNDAETSQDTVPRRDS